MPKLKTITETYDFCLAQGNLKNLEEINFEKIHSLLKNADINLSSAQILTKSLNKNSSEWLNVFTLSYEAFRIYAEALLLFQKISSSNHLCVFSALCLKYSKCVKYSYFIHTFAISNCELMFDNYSQLLYPELELDWYFLERIRTKRHGLNYYGESISYQDWKSVELQLKLYLSLLRKEVEKRLVL